MREAFFFCSSSKRPAGFHRDRKLKGSCGRRSTAYPMVINPIPFIVLSTSPESRTTSARSIPPSALNSPALRMRLIRLTMAWFKRLYVAWAGERTFSLFLKPIFSANPFSFVLRCAFSAFIFLYQVSLSKTIMPSRSVESISISSAAFPLIRSPSARQGRVTRPNIGSIMEDRSPAMIWGATSTRLPPSPQQNIIASFSPDSKSVCIIV